MTIELSKMITIENLQSSEIENIDELIILANEARSFLISHKWCENIKKGMFDRGWGYIVAVFYFAFESTFEGIPDSVWVIVGDLPPAYIDTKDNPNGACAIDAYVHEMQKWVNSVNKGKSVSDLIPVNVPAEKEYADMLQNRLDIIKDEILSKFEDELECL